MLPHQFCGINIFTGSHRLDEIELSSFAVGKVENEDVHGFLGTSMKL